MLPPCCSLAARRGRLRQRVVQSAFRAGRRAAGVGKRRHQCHPPHPRAAPSRRSHTPGRHAPRQGRSSCPARCRSEGIPSRRSRIPEPTAGRRREQHHHVADHGLGRGYGFLHRSASRGGPAPGRAGAPPAIRRTSVRGGQERRGSGRRSHPPGWHRRRCSRCARDLRRRP